MEKKMEDEEIVQNDEVVEQTTNENVETPTTEQKVEQQEFTPEQQRKINEIIQSRVASTKRSEEKKYQKLVNTIKAGMKAETNDVDEITSMARKLYKENGIDIPDEPIYSEEDENILAEAEAQKIIELGYDAIASETDNFTGKTSREKKVYDALMKKRHELENLKSLEQIGVSKEEYTGKEFQDFAKKFNSNTPYTEIYEMYSKMYKKEPSPIGSMKSVTKDDGIKEYYSPEEFDRLTDEQLDNPKIWEAVQKSKEKWV
jgi:hypothetical protein